MIDKKYILVGMFFLLVTGIVFAGNYWAKDIRINEGLNKEIDIEIGEVVCDDVYCYAEIYQEDLINTFWRGKRYYCTEKVDCSKVKNLAEKKKCRAECIEYEEYTEEEIKNLIKEFVEKRINSYLEVEDERGKNETIKVNEGRLTKEDKK